MLDEKRGHAPFMIAKFGDFTIHGDVPAPRNGPRSRPRGDQSARIASPTIKPIDASPIKVNVHRTDGFAKYERRILLFEIEDLRPGSVTVPLLDLRKIGSGRTRDVEALPGVEIDTGGSGRKDPQLLRPPVAIVLLDLRAVVKRAPPHLHAHSTLIIGVSEHIFTDGIGGYIVPGPELLGRQRAGVLLNSSTSREEPVLPSHIQAFSTVRIFDFKTTLISVRGATY
jgi:hypothetical protein